jgi:phenylpropionate dioxygenase-like ring-hydroxylating dioxygenase large terminal subunit
MPQHNGHSPAAVETPPELDLRQLIPKLGLTEYWHPAIRDREVGSKKPVFLKMLGQDLCLFRGQSGKVAALANACPHRGAMLADGDCTFRGFLTCFYHGFTFDERGQCVAAIGEGPDSPMPGKVHARTYPTVTLKGMVFVWMGEGEPVPIEHGVPEEFFDDQAVVCNWSNIWNCNWRPALENVADSHFRYLHRNAVRVLIRPIAPPSLPLRSRPTRINEHRLRAVGQKESLPAATRAWTTGGVKRPYQDYYPGVDAKWPQTRWRYLWTWFFDILEKRRFKRPYVLGEEWGVGEHLPGMFRQNYWSHVFTRWVVPIDEEHSRVVYFHSMKASNWLQRLWARLLFHGLRNWVMNRNFSEQDAKGSIRAYHDTRLAAFHPDRSRPPDVVRASRYQATTR